MTAHPDPDHADVLDVLDVLVVGAGPTGLALAAQLAAFGTRFRIVDRQLDRVHESRALAVQPRTLDVLQGLGVADELVARGNDTIRVELHAANRIVSIPLYGLGVADTAYPFLLFVSQAETEAVLDDHLATHGGAVERGVDLVAFQAGDDGVACTLAHRGGRTEQVRTRYLVGCDGAHSSVRAGAGIAFEGGAYPQTFILADLEIDGDLARDAAHAYVGPAGILFLFPLGRPASWRLLGMHPSPRGGIPSAAEPSEPEPDPAAEPAAPSLAALQTMLDTTGGTLRLRDPVWRTYFSTTATPPATAPGGCFWQATPPTSTAPPARRA